MVRTQARIWIGLLACLLMQVGLLAGISPTPCRMVINAAMFMLPRQTFPLQRKRCIRFCAQW